MKKLYFIVCALFFSQPIYANEVNLPRIYSEQEIQILEKLSERHLQLLEKEKELDLRQKALDAREAALKEQGLQTIDNDKTTYRIYTQLPPQKAVALLNEKTPEECGQILSQMPSAVSAHLINLMPEDRVQAVLQYISQRPKE